jgi:hypothetical protein
VLVEIGIPFADDRESYRIIAGIVILRASNSWDIALRMRWFPASSMRQEQDKLVSPDSKMASPIGDLFKPYAGCEVSSPPYGVTIVDGLEIVNVRDRSARGRGASAAYRDPCSKNVRLNHWHRTSEYARLS